MRAAAAWLVASFGASIPAAAQPGPPADAYDAHMLAGDALERKSRWLQALREFEAALASRPGDGRALTEIGWTAVHAGKLRRAEQASEAALATATDPQLRGAALYNLALAIASKEPYAAAALAFASYRLRPNAAVEKRLVELRKNPRARTPTASEKKRLTRARVEEGPVPRSSRPWNAPIDDALMAALIDAGVEGEGAAGKFVLVVDALSCSETTSATPHTFACANPKATGEAARALVANLVARKVAGKQDGDRVVYTTNVRCAQYHESDDPDECEVGSN